MGKDSPSPPPAPDPAQTAAAQGAANKETAVAQANLNRINQNTPYGSLTYTKIGTNEDGTPQYQSDVTLAPAQQQELAAQNQAGIQFGNIANTQLGNVSSALSQPLNYDNAPAQVTHLDTSGLPVLPSGQVSNHADDLQSVQDAEMARINPQLQQQRQALESRLASQGIAIGSDAYNKAMTLQGQQENDAHNQAIINASNAQSQMIGNDSAIQQLAAQMRAQGLNEEQVQANLQNAGRQQAIQEDTSLRSQPINEISALLNGGQVQNPSFTSVPQVGVANTDVEGPTALAYQGQLAQYQAQNAARQGTLGGLFGLGGSILGAGTMAGAMPGGFLGFA